MEATALPLDAPLAPTPALPQRGREKERFPNEGREKKKFPSEGRKKEIPSGGGKKWILQRGKERTSSRGKSTHQAGSL
jgi:hypothetical protein